MFTGGRISEGIKFWDARAKKCVYELSTGNNSVAALAWDPQNSILHAATVCAYQDLHGYHHGYRRAARVKRRDDIQEGIGGADVHLWPEDAVHDEFSFGYMYDAGEHSLCEDFHLLYSGCISSQPEIINISAVFVQK